MALFVRYISPISSGSGGGGGVTSLAPVGSAPNANGGLIAGSVLTLEPADSTHPGVLTAIAQSIGGVKNFNANIFAANLSGTNSGDVTIGTANGLSLIGQALGLALSSTSTTGALSSTDWNTFNAKQPALTIGNLTDVGTDGIVITGGTGAVIGSGTSIAQHVSDSTHNGYLASADWITFNAKQAALTIGNITDAGTDGIVITGGTGAIIGSGVSIAQTKADGTHNGYLSSTDWTTFNGKQAAGNYITALSGDATASGPGSAALTLATVNSNVGSFGSSTAIPSFTVNAKGLITAASTNVVIAPAGTLTGATLASNVLSSSLTSVGTIATGVWNGTSIAIANGGTGQGTKAAAFDALSPMTTAGDIIYGGVSGTGTRLAGGTSTFVLTSNGPTSAPSWQAASSAAIRSQIMTVTGNGYGSSNVSVRRWVTPSISTGSDITYTDSATLGTKFTAVTTGLYAISYTDFFGSNASRMGITINGTQGTLSIQSITDGSIRAFSFTTSGNRGFCSWTGLLTAGDFVWCQTDQNTPTEAANGNANIFTIVKIGA